MDITMKIIKQNISKFLLLTMAVVGLSLSSATFAGVVVISHPSNNATLTAKDLKRIFLGKTGIYPGGGKAVPLDQKNDSPAHKAFYTKVVKKEGRKLKSYWSKMMFSGKKQPPPVVDTVEELIKIIAADPAAIGYIDESALAGTTSVKIIFTVPL
jgi:ABC-type phosphate transport system substrate-binding protein